MVNDGLDFSSGSEIQRRLHWVGADAGPEGTTDLGVLDDVWPMGEDPATPGVLEHRASASSSVVSSNESWSPSWSRAMSGRWSAGAESKMTSSSVRRACIS